GNPLLVESIVGAKTATRIPGDVEAAIDAQLRGLSPTCLSVLELAAALVPDLSVDALIRIGRWDHDAVVAAVDEAAIAGGPTADARALRFTPPRAQRRCLGRMGPIAQARAHAEIARALGPPEGAALFGVARHLVLADTAADAGEVARVAAIAGQHASAVGAWE